MYSLTQSISHPSYLMHHEPKHHVQNYPYANEAATVVQDLCRSCMAFCYFILLWRKVATFAHNSCAKLYVISSHIGAFSASIPAKLRPF